MNHPDRAESTPSYSANLRRYWREHLAHLSVGCIAGLLLLTDAPWAGVVIIATVWVRQTLEFQKRRDTPGIDLAYHLAGLLLGVGAGLLAKSTVLPF